MVEFFRSAMSYLSGEGEGGGGGGGGSAFVGQTVDVGEGMKLKVKKVIAEGKDDPLPLNTPPYPLLPFSFPYPLLLSLFPLPSSSLFFPVRWLWVCIYSTGY